MRDDEKCFRIAKLLAKQRVVQLSARELQELKEWKEATLENKNLYERWQTCEFLESDFKNFQKVRRQEALEKMNERIRFQRKKRLQLRFFRWSSIAAVIVVVIFIGVNLFNKEQKELPQEQGTITLTKVQCPTLKLDNGTVILLDSLKNNFKEAGILVGKTGESTLSYSVEDLSTDVSLAYNVIEVPKGAEFDLILSDGTRVWLNANSKLRYPVAFGSGKREVELEGEGYFKVTKDERPFRVVAKNQTIEVLGTEFNVDAYTEEKNVYTTLVRGKVQISTQNQAVFLEPGMQAVFDGTQVLTRSVNVSEVVSWRNGMFVLEDHTLEEIMAKLARWYDFTVFYQNASLKELSFKGKIPRYVSFESILNILEKTNEVKFHVNNQTVVVYK